MTGSIAVSARRLASAGRIEPLKPGKLVRRAGDSGAFEYELSITPASAKFPLTIVLYGWPRGDWGICCEQSCVQIDEMNVFPLSQVGLVGPINFQHVADCLEVVVDWWEKSGSKEINRLFPGPPGADRNSAS